MNYGNEYFIFTSSLVKPVKKVCKHQYGEWKIESETPCTHPSPTTMKPVLHGFVVH